MTPSFVRLAYGFLGLSALLLGPTLTGCSSSDDEGSSSSDFARRYCALFKPCCQDAGFPASDQQACRFLFASAKVKDPSAVDQCLSDYEQLAQDPQFCTLSLPNPESCERAFEQNPQSTGTKKPGEPCERLSDDCAGDATCDTELGADQGVCVEFVIVGDGQSCIGVRNEGGSIWSGDAINNQITLCDGDADFYCSSSGACKKRAAVGQACEGSSSCLDDGYCASGVCAPKLATGSPCPNFSDECNEAAYCSDTTQTCEPRADDGASCSWSDECLSDYCDDGTCKVNPGLSGLGLAFVCN
jgi:hypothetical protein